MALLMKGGALLVHNKGGRWALTEDPDLCDCECDGGGPYCGGLTGLEALYFEFYTAKASGTEWFTEELQPVLFNGKPTGQWKGEWPSTCWVSPLTDIITVNCLSGGGFNIRWELGPVAQISHDFSHCAYVESRNPLRLEFDPPCPFAAATACNNFLTILRE